MYIFGISGHSTLTDHPEIFVNQSLWHIPHQMIRLVDRRISQIYSMLCTLFPIPNTVIRKEHNVISIDDFERSSF